MLCFGETTAFVAAGLFNRSVLYCHREARGQRRGWGVSGLVELDLNGVRCVLTWRFCDGTHLGEECSRKDREQRSQRRKIQLNKKK